MSKYAIIPSAMFNPHSLGLELLLFFLRRRLGEVDSDIDPSHSFSIFL